MPWQLEFLIGGFPADAGTFNAGVFNSSSVSFNQEAGDPFTGVNYRVVPFPGELQPRPQWQYRAGDAGQMWKARIVDQFDPTNVLPLTGVASANLLLSPIGYGNVDVTLLFPLTLDTGSNAVHYTFQDDDLAVAGAYRAAVKLVSNNGRGYTLNPDDRSVVTVKQ